MPWLLGIDEAGYGPNLGPFVMSSALFYLPESCDSNLWKVLHLAVRRATQKADGRLIVDDSKQVYSPKIGLGVLEKNLWPFIALKHSTIKTVHDLWQAISLTTREAVRHEPYCAWEQPIPCSPQPASSLAMLTGVLSRAGVNLEKLATSIVMPREFNRLTREADSKAAVPVNSIKQLLAKLPAEEEISITIDRLGGRHRYLDIIQDWFPGQSVTIESETPTLSRYRIGSRITIAFQVEGDQHSFPVALSSMLSKYWRELLMAQFNGWFLRHHPSVAPTAGYPLDATRFWNDVIPVREKLRLNNDDWWRER